MSVYAALIDPVAVQQWMVPEGMTSEVHEFAAVEGGRFRISLTYDEPTSAGKSSAHTDTFHGSFTRLIPGEVVEQLVEFESDDPGVQGEMRITYTLVAADGGTEVTGVHEGVPAGVDPAANEEGWRMSLDKLARLVESASTT